MFEALHKLGEIVGPNYPPKGLFEVYSEIGGEAMSKPLSWDKAWQELESCCYAGGAGSALDVRRATEGANNV